MAGREWEVWLARLGCGVELTSMSFRYRIGRLSDLDIANISALLSGE